MHRKHHVISDGMNEKISNNEKFIEFDSSEFFYHKVECLKQSSKGFRISRDIRLVVLELFGICGPEFTDLFFKYYTNHPNGQLCIITSILLLYTFHMPLLNEILEEGHSDSFRFCHGKLKLR